MLTDNQLIVLTNIRWQVPKVHSYQSKQQLKIKLTCASSYCTNASYYWC